MRALLVACLLLPTALLVPAASADYDEGTGDAPNACEDALTVPPGLVRGATPGWDVDTYRVEVPAGKAASVSLEAVEGGYLQLYDSDCTYVTSRSSGSTAALAPVGGNVRFRVDGWGAGAYTVNVLLFDAPAQDDAGTGRDAGNGWTAATTVPAGRINGRLMTSGGDWRDWYRVQAASDEYVRVTVGSSSEDVLLVSSDGYLLGRMAGWSGVTSTSLVPPGGVLLLGIEAWSSSSSYAVDVTLHKRTDLAVVGLRSDAAPLTVGGLVSPTPPNEEVAVTLANEGIGASLNARLLVYTTVPGGTIPQRILYDRPVAMDAGTTQTVRFPWDTTGQVGRFELHAVVTNGHDLDERDNAARLVDDVFVGGMATGVDALNARVLAGGSTAGIDYDAGRRGADASAYVPVYYVPGGSAAAWVDGEGRVRASAGACALYCVGL